MSRARRIIVRVPSGRYSVLCGRGTLARVGKEVEQLGDHTGIFVLSSPRVWKLWGRALEGSFRGVSIKAVLFDDRERMKKLVTVERVCRQLARAGADRRAVMVTLGGGVVGDVAGFVAASYLRGVELVHVPTTLVAQVDSAIGGKTGVNLPEGKNLVGAFYQPRVVIADLATLATLPLREYRSGLYEVVKYGVIGDRRLFGFLEHNLDAVVRRKPAELGWIVPRCICAKAEVVSRDERESGPRAILNFGHTLGHALESVMRYTRFLHGEAIGWGMMAATLIAVALDRIGTREAARILRLVASVGPLPELPRISAARLLKALRADKKARGGRLRFVLPRRIGKVEVVADVPDALVVEVVRQLPRLVRQVT